MKVHSRYKTGYIRKVRKRQVGKAHATFTVEIGLDEQALTLAWALVKTSCCALWRVESDKCDLRGLAGGPCCTPSVDLMLPFYTAL